LIVSAMMGFTIVQTTDQMSSRTNDQLASQANAHANDLETDIVKYREFAQSLSATMENYDKATASRAEVNAMLREQLEDHPNALGVYVAYEPNAFDGNDSQYVNDSATGSNHEGRFAPYWNRYGGSANLAPLHNLESYDWYTKPVTSEEYIIKGPFVYQGRMMLSFIYPIERDGEVIGIAGIDVSIDYWQNRTAQVDVGESGYAFVVSRDGRFVAHPNESLVGSTNLSAAAARTGTPELRQMQADVESGTPGSFTMTDPVTGQRAFVQYHPVETGGFTIATVSPRREALAGVTGLRNVLIVISTVSLLALLGVVTISTRRITRPIQRVVEKAERIESGEYDVKLASDRTDEIGDLFGSISGMRDSLVTNIEEAETARTEAQAARSEAEELSAHLESKAADYAAALERLADGDFTTRVDPESRHDGMQSIGETLNTVAHDLEATLADVQRFSESVAASMQQLSASANQIEQASGNVSTTVSEITNGADEQRNRLETVTREMNDLSATVEEVASTSSEVVRRAERTAERSQEGRESAEQAVTALDEIQAETEEAVSEVNELVEQIEAISEFTEVIGEVAEQTNMLALNANVEAARTDTDGDGFAVVADEIKQLAVEAGNHAEQTRERIDAIQSQTGTTASVMRDAADRIDESSDTVEAAIDALVEVDDLVTETADGIQDINRATDDQATSTEEVAAMVDEVAEIADQTARDAEEVAAAADRQTSSTGEVSRTAEELADDAADLSRLVNQFRIDPNDLDAAADATNSPATTPDGGVIED
jgi:methyl-accepting chemotaxis protein